MADDNEPKIFLTYTASGLAIIVGFLSLIGVIEKSDAAMWEGILIPLAIAGLRRGQVNDAKKVKKALIKQQEVVKEAIVQAEIDEKKPCPPVAEVNWK